LFASLCYAENSAPMITAKEDVTVYGNNETETDDVRPQIRHDYAGDYYGTIVSYLKFDIGQYRKPNLTQDVLLNSTK
jgi:hypothetical protein